MIKICVLTATRAEYGLLKPIIKKLSKDPLFDLKVVVTGAHLSPEYGLTYKEIEEDGITIDKKIEVLLSSNTQTSISKSMGIAMIAFADYFEEKQPDVLLVLGDRYETLSVAMVAMNQQIPIAHLYGGETTEGAIDESIRHAISKMSYLHFTSTEDHKRRVVQLGESPDRVFNVGAMGIENIMQEKLLSKAALEASIEFTLDKPYAVVTYHPVTLNPEASLGEINELLECCSEVKSMKFIFTKANADANGKLINERIREFIQSQEHMILVDSLGMKRYLSALKYAEMVIGNSSSGLIEAPSFFIPTINIGERQRGRLQGETVINCEANKVSITEAISKAMDEKFTNKIKKTKNPYGNGKSSDQVISRIKTTFVNKEIDLKKKFYDLQ